jgi:signal transduction histidine kinase/CheY-like chemotaxis protein
VSSFAESPDGNIWVGTNGGGLSYWNRNTGKFIRYNPEAGKNSLSSWGVLSLCQSKSGYLWIGSYGGGVDRYDATNKTFKNYKKGTGPGDLNNDQVYALFEDSKGNLWIGTNGGGVNVMNGSTGFITRYVHGADRPNSLAGNYIRAFYEDKAGKIWIGTSTGLSVYNPATAKFSVYDQSNSDLESDLIFSIKGDLQNNIWIGTVGGGLSMWNEKANKFFTYTTNDGLADNTINSIIADDKGYLWLSTNNGICQFDVVRKKSKNYDPLNGIQSFEYNQNAGLITSKGEILFGGINGFNAFYPETFKDNKNVAPVLITGLSLFNKPVRAGAKNSPLKTSILETEEIQLSYDQSIITISYGAVNMTATRRNNYAYKLEGFDKDWNYVNGNRTATYTNLSPGEYLFRVKGSNNDGIWNEQETTLKILVKPPYWKTTWFRLLAILIIAASIFFYYKRRMSSILEREHELAAQVLERTEKLEQLSIQERNTRRQAEQSRYEAERARHEAERANSAKSSFLATMSHEIRTPMNGVIGTTSLLKETELTGEQQKYVEVIQSSGQNLLAVINDILDFSKIESGKIDLENHSFSLKECIVEVMNLFIAITVKNNIKLHYKIDGDVPPQVLGDSVRLKQILINLVGNATKFTQQGEIFLGVSVTEQKENGVKLKFAVQDTGIGIPLDKQERLFKAFTQVDSTTTRKYGGSGLGLAISKKLVEVMGGSIDICSEENKGTCFTFSIVTGIDALYKKKTADNMSTDAAKKLSTGFALKYPLNILVAEDNPVNQMIAMNVLKKLGYSADLAINGAKAVEAFEVKDYDLILMDIQMPEMDGFEATKTIRNTFKSKPVIIAVTANAMQEDKDACLAAGMDDYISKPIALDKLLLLLEKWGNVIKTKVPVI